MGAVKFALIHHASCYCAKFHIQIEQNGSLAQLMELNKRGHHPHSIGILVNTHCDLEFPTQAQIKTLKELLVNLKLQFPDILVGAHRQVRGDRKTTCPGRKFPMNKINSWVKDSLPLERDTKIYDDIASQYGP